MIKEQILLGSLLGDGCIVNNTHNNLHYEEGHSLRQKDYLLWKNKYLKFNERVTKLNRIKIDKGDTRGLRKLYQLFYGSGKKKVTKTILGKLTPLGLAVWFCDDGCYNYRGNILQLHTNGFSLNEHYLMRRWFKQRWKINGYITKWKPPKTNHILNGIKMISRKNVYYYFAFRKEDTEKILRIIKPFVIKMSKDVHYKVGLDKKKRRIAEEKLRKHYRKVKKSYKGEIVELHKRWSRKHYLKNREKLLMRMKKRSEIPSVKRRILKYQKGYYKKNKDKKKAYYVKNRKKILKREAIRYRQKKVMVEDG